MLHVDQLCSMVHRSGSLRLVCGGRTHLGGLSLARLGPVDLGHLLAPVHGLLDACRCSMLTSFAPWCTDRGVSGLFAVDARTLEASASPGLAQSISGTSLPLSTASLMVASHLLSLGLGLHFHSAGLSSSGSSCTAHAAAVGQLRCHDHCLPWAVLRSSCCAELTQAD